MIYTTYFAQLRNLPPSIVPVSICAKAPAWFTGVQYKRLAPQYSLLMHWKSTHDKMHYRSCYYNDVLNKLDIKDVLQFLKNIAADKEIALVCYEKPSDFCHRHLVAEWLNKNGVECKEWQK